MALEATELQTYQMIGLPMLVTSPVDVGRLQRELEVLSDKISQTELRGEAPAKLAKTSQLLDRVIELNNLNLLVAADRARLQGFLEAVHAKAPVMHISFSADPSTAFVEKLMTWLRREIHPLLLMTIGLQPNLGAGCVVRSTNAYFDMSLRQSFLKNEQALRDVLGPALAGKSVALKPEAVA